MTLNSSVTDEQLGQFYRRTFAIAGRLGKSLNFDDVMNELQQIHDGQVRVSSQFLRRLYSGKEIIVGATTGEETIANTSDVFTGFLDLDFKNRGTNKPSGVATELSLAEIYESSENVTFNRMFSSLGREINTLCWEQGQIINFCREHRDKLQQDGYGTFFLFKVKGIDRPFVASVGLDSAKLKAFVYRFDYDYVWGAECCHRLVVPQLET